MDWVAIAVLAVLLGLGIWAHRSVATFAVVFFPIFIKKLPLALLTMWLVATAVFCLAKLAGDDKIVSEGRVDAAVQENLKRQWGLDKPVWVQYGIQMRRLVVFDTMPSRMQQNKTMRDIIRVHMPKSASLGWRALAIAIVFGVPIGVFCALHHNRWFDQVGKIVALGGVSVPSFILASLVVFFLGRRLQWFNPTEWDNQTNLWFAATCLAAFPFAATLRLTRASMLEALREDYVRTARAKGVSEFKVIFQHALRNALGSIVTYLGPVTAGVLVGSLVVERIFFIPGLGDMFVTSIQNRDTPLILGSTVFYSSLLVTMNLVVDSLYPVLNPRLRHG